MSRSGFRLAALVLLGLLFAVNCYRAATQSIVHDEALTWELYLAGPASAIFNYYDPNHHFLATVLFRISTTLFGNSELAMRLPTLLAGAWFFWTVVQLCSLVFGDGWFFLLGCAALTLNPFLLDFLVAARGYGLAVAGLFWALFQMLAWLQDRSRGSPDEQLRKRLWKAALGCSVAVAANLTLLIPVFVLAAAFCIPLMRRLDEATRPPASPLPSKPRKKGKKTQRETAREPGRSYTSLMHFVVPVLALAIAFLLAAPIDLARSRDFYVGKQSAIASLSNLMEVSFAYGKGSGSLGAIEQIWTNIALFFLPIAVLAALVVAWTAARRQPSIAETTTLFASLAVVGSAILLAAAHLLSGIPYPSDRTGIYFVPLATLAALGLARTMTERPGLPRWIGFAAAAVLVSFTIEFAAQWNVKSFWVWPYDADTKRVFQALEAAPKQPGQVRLGVSWVFEPALNYYREIRKASWLAPVLRDGFDGVRQFYVVSPEDQNTAVLPKLKQIYKGPVSGALLAIPQ